MSYRKPRVRIRSGETCDQNQINRTIQPAVQELSGHVIDHNVVAGTFPQSRVSSGCYYQVGSSAGTPYYKSVAADMNITGGGTGSPTATAKAWRVPDTVEWSVIGASPDDLAFTITTGEGVLWIITQIQHGLVGTNIGLGFIDKPNVEYAIRVDGIVLDDCPTGLEEAVNPADRQYYPPTPTDRAGTGPYSIHTFSTQNCEPLGFPVYPTRLISFAPVDEGTHIIEIVARRLPLGPTEDGSQYAATPLYVFNRKALVVDMHLQAPATGTAASFEVATINEGDTVSAATTYTNTVAAIVAQENNLGDGAMARNALRNEHLPSRVQMPNNVGLTGGDNTNTAYPGYGTIGTAAGWKMIDDAAAVLDCKTTNGPYNFTANPGFVILLANVAVSNIAVRNGFADSRIYAWFTLQYVYTSGVEFGNASTEMAINNPNLLPNPGLVGDNMDPIEADVPLFEYFDWRAAPPAGGQVQNFRVLGGNSWRQGGGTADVHWRKSNIALVSLKP